MHRTPRITRWSKNGKVRGGASGSRTDGRGQDVVHEERAAGDEA